MHHCQVRREAAECAWNGEGMSFPSNELEPDYDSGDVPNFAGVGVRQFRGGGSGGGDTSAPVSPGGVTSPLGAASGGTPTSEFFPSLDEPYMFHSHARLSCGRFPRFTKQTVNPAAGPKAVTPTPIFMRPPSVFSASSAPARMARLVDTPMRASPARNNTSPYVPLAGSPVGSPEPDMSASLPANYAMSQSIPDGLANMANPPMLSADQRSHSVDELPTSALLMRRVRQSPKPAGNEERELAFGMPVQDTPTPSALEQAGVVGPPPGPGSATDTQPVAAVELAADPAGSASAAAAPTPLVADQTVPQEMSASSSPTPTRTQAPAAGLVPVPRSANEGMQRDPWDSTSPSTQSLATPGTSVDSPRLHSNSPQAMMPPPVPSTENVRAAETSPDTMDARHRSGLDALDDFLWQNPNIYSDADALSLDDASRYSAASRVKSSKLFSGAPPSLQMVAELRDRDSVASSFRGPPVPPNARASMVILDAGEAASKGGPGARSANHAWAPPQATPASEEELPPLPPKDHLLRVLQSQDQAQDSSMEDPRDAAAHSENEAYAANGFGMVPLGEQAEVPVIALRSQADEPPAAGAPGGVDAAASGEPPATEEAAPTSEVVTPAVDVTPPAGDKSVPEGEVSGSGMRLLNQGAPANSDAGDGEIPVIPLGARPSADTPPFSSPRMADEIPSISLGTPKGPTQPTVTEIPVIPLHSFPDRTPTRTPETSAWQHGIRPKCQRCEEPIRRFAVRSLDNVLTGLYHRECFDCEVCHARFPDGIFYVHEGRPHCHQHYHERCGVLCTVCGKGVESVYRKVGTDANYHLHCLSCEFAEDDAEQVCGIQLSDFYLIQGRRYCEPHAFKMLEKHYAQQGVPATLERRTSMLVN